MKRVCVLAACAAFAVFGCNEEQASHPRDEATEVEESHSKSQTKHDLQEFLQKKFEDQNVEPDILTYSELSPIPESVKQQKNKARTLYKRLLEFKDNPTFQRCGFGACGSFTAWKTKVNQLAKEDKEADSNFYRFTGFSVMDLYVLATEYLNTKGRDGEYAKTKRPHIEHGLLPRPEISKGEGIVIRTRRACKNVRPFNQSDRAIRRGQFDKNFLTEYDCPLLYLNTVVKGPLDHTQDASGTWLVKVRSEEHSELWVPTKTIAFNLEERQEATGGELSETGMSD